MEEIKTIETALKEVLRMIRDAFGEGYAIKNPELVRFLLDQIQQEKNRASAYALKV